MRLHVVLEFWKVQQFEMISILRWRIGGKRKDPRKDRCVNNKCNMHEYEFVPNVYIGMQHLLLFRDISVYAIKVLIYTGKCIMQLYSIPFRFFFLFLPLIFPLSLLLFIYFYSLSLCIPAVPFLICMRVIAYNKIFVHTAADCFAHNNTNDTHPNNNNLITKNTIQNHVVLPSFS